MSWNITSDINPGSQELTQKYKKIKPKSLEAITLHHIDYLFSRLDPCFESLEDREGEWGKEKLKALGNGYAWIGAAPVEE